MTVTKKQIILEEALVIRHPQDTKKVSVTGVGCLLGCKNTEFVNFKGYGVQATKRFCSGAVLCVSFM